jgi:hypothetical protein
MIFMDRMGKGVGRMAQVEDKASTTIRGKCVASKKCKKYYA